MLQRQALFNFGELEVNNTSRYMRNGGSEGGRHKVTGAWVNEIASFFGSARSPEHEVQSDLLQ